MNTYRVGFRTEKGIVWEEVTAYDISVSGGVIIFFERPGQADRDICAVYKTYDLLVRRNVERER